MASRCVAVARGPWAGCSGGRRRSGTLVGHMSHLFTTRVTGVVQARMGSTRLPGKVLRPLGGRPVLSWVLRALEESGACGPLVVATTGLAEDDAVARLAAEQGAEVVRGDVDDVLGRFLAALERHPDQPVLRVTADCPLLDPQVIAMTARAFDAATVDYLSTVTPRSLSHGLDVEVAAPDALRRAGAHAEGVDRSHVTSYLYREPGRFRVAGLTFSPSAADLRVTLDTPEDAALLDRVVAHFGDRSVGREELVAFLRANPEIAAINAEVQQKRIEEG
jgi:spore coat polysaccharide biosynthesis protein SpsF